MIDAREEGEEHCINMGGIMRKRFGEKRTESCYWAFFKPLLQVSPNLSSTSPFVCIARCLQSRNRFFPLLLPARLPMRYSAYVLLFPVWVGFAAGVNVYLPWPSCRAAKAHRHVTDTETGKSRTYALYRVVTVVWRRNGFRVIQ